MPKQSNLFLILILFTVLVLFLYSNFDIFSYSKSNIEEIILRSKCPCHSEVIQIDKIDSKYLITIKDKNDLNRIIKNYTISNDQYKSKTLSCNLYNVLRRGPNQMVIGYSLYGKERLYYDYLEMNIKLAKALYRDWIIRIYHDDSIDESIICEKQCFRDSNQELYDNIDFCNIGQLPYDFSTKWNANYMLPMSWRWLPLGDDFVDVFVSRDTDSCIIKREADAVNEWINSNKEFHIMRDHPSHGNVILGGMWGYYNKRNREMSKHFYNQITSRLVSFYYKTYMMRRQPDQFMLANYFWQISKKSALIHDSYNCEILSGSKPFPSKRIGNCFIGNIGCCNPDQNITFLICPKSCRKNEEWLYC